MSSKTSAVSIATLMLCLCAWPALGTPKRDAAFQKCHDQNLVCESKCVNKSGAAYKVCTDACTTSYRQCNDNADKIPRIQSVIGSDLPALRQGSGKTSKKKLP